MSVLYHKYKLVFLRFNICFLGFSKIVAYSAWLIVAYSAWLIIAYTAWLIVAYSAWLIVA